MRVLWISLLCGLISCWGWRPPMDAQGCPLCGGEAHPPPAGHQLVQSYSQYPPYKMPPFQEPPPFNPYQPQGNPYYPAQGNPYQGNPYQPDYGNPYQPHANPYQMPYGNAPSYQPYKSYTWKRLVKPIVIRAYDDYFQPKVSKIPPGTTVHWVNYGKHDHTVTFGDGYLDSGDIAPGGTYTATFEHPGTYQYFCRHHQGMRATLVVGKGGGPVEPYSSGPYGGSRPSGY